MSNADSSFLGFLRGQEICQIAFGMYDVQINWGSGGLTCMGMVVYEPVEGSAAVWTEGHPFDGVPLLRLLRQTISEFDSPSDGVLALQFSKGDCLTITPENGFESFTIHQEGKPLIVGR
jgi:hypothetical protein